MLKKMYLIGRIADSPVNSALQLPNVFWFVGIVIHLLGAVFHVVHVELFLLAVQNGFYAQIVGLVGVHGLAHDDVPQVAGRCPFIV